MRCRTTYILNNKFLSTKNAEKLTKLKMSNQDQIDLRPGLDNLIDPKLTCQREKKGVRC